MGTPPVFSFKLSSQPQRTRRCNPGMAPFTLQASAGCGVPHQPAVPCAWVPDPAPRILPQSASRRRRERHARPDPRRSAHRLAFAVTLSGQLSLPSRALRMSWAARGRGRLGSSQQTSRLRSAPGGQPGAAGPSGRRAGAPGRAGPGAPSPGTPPQPRRSPKSRARSGSHRAGPVTARGAGAAAPRPPVYALRCLLAF